MFPTLKTGRFLLREIRKTDQQGVFEGLSHPDVVRYYGISFHTFDEALLQMNWYNSIIKDKTGIWWAICYHHQANELIGCLGFNYWKKEHKRTEIGFWLLPLYWRKGVMMECVPEIIKYAFRNMNIHRIEGVVESENNNSSRLLKKLNFSYEGTLKDVELKQGRFISLDYYALLK